MTVKEARVALRLALRKFRARIRFPQIRTPKLSVREILQSEDLKSIVKEYAQGSVQSYLERRR